MKKTGLKIMFLLRITCFTIMTGLYSISGVSGNKMMERLSGNDFPDVGMINNDSVYCSGTGSQTGWFARFVREDPEGDQYMIRLSMFNSSSERLAFYNEARRFGIFMMDKNEFNNDSTLFIVHSHDRNETMARLEALFTEVRKTKGSDPSSQDLNRDLWVTCETAMEACGGNAFTYPSGTTGTAIPPTGGYPNYGCLGSEPCPAWFYMRIGLAGDIILLIEQSNFHDVDFICWGPFTSLTDGCATGLTGTCHSPGGPNCCDNTNIECWGFYPQGNMVDCSYSPQPSETCHILNTQPGEIYILMITNFSMQPGTITFSQIDGTGMADCSIVLHCSMIAMTGGPSTCNPSTNTFSISGNIEFSNPPSTGTLTITDNTVIPPVSQVFNAPFTSPHPYSLNGIPCDGLSHTITAAFSDSVTCTMNRVFTSPPQVVKTLVVKAYLEGMYDKSSGMMNKSLDVDPLSLVQFDKWPGNHADTLSVLLVQDLGPNWPDPIPYNYKHHGSFIETNGTITLSELPLSLSDNYYIILKHRQSVETWSSLPVSFAGNNITYDFTTAMSQAFGGNLKDLTGSNGPYGLWGGDVTGVVPDLQDGFVDIFDNNQVYNDNLVVAMGYIIEDITGCPPSGGTGPDGFVDIFDMVLVFNNLQQGAGRITPPFPAKK